MTWQPEIKEVVVEFDETALGPPGKQPQPIEIRVERPERINVRLEWAGQKVAAKVKGTIEFTLTDPNGKEVKTLPLIPASEMWIKGIPVRLPQAPSGKQRVTLRYQDDLGSDFDTVARILRSI